MKKDYRNKKLTTDASEGDNHYFFPKANPPVTITADSLEEAEAKLQKIRNKKHE